MHHRMGILVWVLVFALLCTATAAGQAKPAKPAKPAALRAGGVCSRPR